MATAKTTLVKVNGMRLTQNLDVRSFTIVVPMNDDQLSSSDKTMAYATEVARKRYGDEARISSISRW